MAAVNALSYVIPYIGAVYNVKGIWPVINRCIYL